MGVAKWQGQDNNIQQDNKSEYVPVFSNKNEGFLHDHVAKDIKERVFIEHFEYLEAPISKYLIDQVVFFQIKFHGDLIDGKLIELIDLGFDLELMVEKVVELEFEFLNEVEDIDLLEVGAVGVLVHAFEFD
jgi:hypothetical protein